MNTVGYTDAAIEPLDTLLRDSLSEQNLAMTGLM